MFRWSLAVGRVLAAILLVVSATAAALAQTAHGHADPSAAAAATVATVTGTLNAVDAKTRKLNISHPPIPALGWPEMTMDFNVAEGIDLAALKPGTKVTFGLGHRPGDGMVVVNTLAPATR